LEVKVILMKGWYARVAEIAVVTIEIVARPIGEKRGDKTATGDRSIY
jgi:hypothetical protein